MNQSTCGLDYVITIGIKIEWSTSDPQVVHKWSTSGPRLKIESRVVHKWTTVEGVKNVLACEKCCARSAAAGGVFRGML